MNKTNQYGHTRMRSYIQHVAFRYDLSRLVEKDKKKLVAAFTSGYIGTRSGMVHDLYKLLCEQFDAPYITVSRLCNFGTQHQRLLVMRFDQCHCISDEMNKHLDELVTADAVVWRMENPASNVVGTPSWRRKVSHSMWQTWNAGGALYLHYPSRTTAKTVAAFYKNSPEYKAKIAPALRALEHGETLEFNF